MSNEKTTNRGMAAIIGVLAIFTATQATFILNPALASLSTKYPDLPYSTLTYLTTIPNLVGIPMGVISGALIKKNMKYKHLLVIALALMIIGGALPYVITNFTGWLAARCLFGVGFGIVVPMSGTMVMRTFQGAQASQVQGWGTVIQNLSGIILQVVSGWICMLSVDYVWLVHFIFVIPLIALLVFAPEPAAETTDSVSDTGEKAKLPVSVYLMSMGYGLLFMCVYPLLLNMSGILANEGIGDAGLAGTISSLYTVGGMISGILFPYMLKALKKWLIPVLAVGTAIAIMIGYIGTTPAVLMFASLLTGVCAMMIWPASIVYFSGIVDGSGMALANGIFSGAINLFCFLASPFISTVAAVMGDNPRNALLAGAIGIAIIAVCYFIGMAKSKDNA